MERTGRHDAAQRRDARGYVTRPGGRFDQRAHHDPPGTEATTHYFFASTRDFRLDDAELNEEIRLVRAEIFSTEDEPMIAAQQARMGDAEFWSLKSVPLRIDEAAVDGRRRMEAMIAGEQSMLVPAAL